MTALRVMMTPLVVVVAVMAGYPSHMTRVVHADPIQQPFNAPSTPLRQHVWLVHLHPRVEPSQLSAGHDSDKPTTMMANVRAQRREAVYQSCRALVSDAQTRAVAFVKAQSWRDLAASSISIDPVWIQNTLLVRFQLPAASQRTRDGDGDGDGGSDGGDVDVGMLSQVAAFMMHELPWFPGVLSVENDDDTGLELIAPALIPPIDTLGLDRKVQHLMEATQEDGGDPSLDGTEPQKNIRLLQAPALWQTGLQGEGVTVASIDSGVRYTHEALRSTFRGATDGSKTAMTTTTSSTTTTHGVNFDYSFWFPPGTDMSKETPDTADEVGHGTHTMGTAVGQRGIGMAPRATWIAARAFDLRGAVTKSDFLLAMQWVICPTKLDGTGRNCSLGADVITGSFGVDRSDVATYRQWTWITHVLQVWRAAGSTPVFASGNTNGFQCGSVYYPASRIESLAVGALVGGSTLWGASGKGPSMDGQDDAPEDDPDAGLAKSHGPGVPVLKPDFVAPGAAIRSALSTTDSAYTRLTGTSMATPHLAGAMALLLSGGKPHESAFASSSPPEDLIASLRRTATRGLSKPFLVPSHCGNTTYREYPNNIYGYGLPNVCLAAVDARLVTACSSSTTQQAETSSPWQYRAIEEEAVVSSVE